MELVSVVIPAYNAATTLPETVASVTAQTWDALEIVIVDDGSRDDTKAVAERLAAEDGRIRVVAKPNGGVAEARNLGFAEARGDYVCPVDADDLLAPTKIEAQMRRMADIGPRCGYVYSLSRKIGPDSRILRFSTGLPGFEGPTFLRALAINFVGNGSALLLRRAAVEEVGGYDSSLHRAGAQGAEDFLLQALIARRWLVGFVDAHLCGYRILPQAMSSDPTRMRRSRLMSLDIVADRVPETPPSALRAARAATQAGLGAAIAASGRLSAAAPLARALAEHPVAALDVLLRDEARRALAPTARRLLERIGLARARETTGPGLRFVDMEPGTFGGPRTGPLALGWLLRRLAAQEAAFFATAQEAAPTSRSAARA